MTVLLFHVDSGAVSPLEVTALLEYRSYLNPDINTNLVGVKVSLWLLMDLLGAVYWYDNKD